MSASHNALAEVRCELDNARTRFPAFASAHEGIAVIREEFDELWQEIKNDKQPAEERRNRMRAEAKQLAAMALRFMVDLT